MDYVKQYIALIRHAETRLQPAGYLEKHHTFPKSIFGENKRIVLLTAREHYIAHALLEKIYIKRYGMSSPLTHKMTKAFYMMNNVSGIGQQRYTNSHLYEANKLRFIDSVTGKNNPMYGKKRIFTEQHLANLKASRTYGKDNPLFGIPRSEETKEKMRKPKHSNHGKLVSQGRKGMKFSEEHRKNLSLSHLGNIPKNKGKSKLLFELILPTGDILVLNGCELQTFAIEHKLNHKGLRIASRSNCQFKDYKIKDISQEGSK